MHVCVYLCVYIQIDKYLEVRGQPLPQLLSLFLSFDSGSFAEPTPHCWLYLLASKFWGDPLTLFHSTGIAVCSAASSFHVDAVDPNSGSMLARCID